MSTTTHPFRIFSFTLLAVMAGSLSAQASTTEETFEASPTNRSEASRSLLEAQRDELRFIQGDGIFPTTPIAAIDPISKKKVSKVLTGPTFLNRSGDKSYDYYRYVTFYNISTRKERIYALPIQRENCEDRSEAFASYSHSYNFTASVSASASVEGLGLSTSISESRTFSTTRSLRATGGVIAEHVPYFEKQDWKGRTFIQTYNSKTKKAALITKQEKASNLLVFLLFPIAAHGPYPMPFSIKDADWTFLVERNILSSCEEGKKP